MVSKFSTWMKESIAKYGKCIYEGSEFCIFMTGNSLTTLPYPHDPECDVDGTPWIDVKAELAECRARMQNMRKKFDDIRYAMLDNRLGVKARRELVCTLCETGKRL